MPTLIEPTATLHAAWLEARADWGPGSHEDGFGLTSADDVTSAAGFAAWVKRLADTGSTRHRWVVEGDAVLGGIALRCGDTEFTRQFGHIGYGIRPSARGRGVATRALGAMLGEARALGLPAVLLVCAAGNIASARTIERNGGVLETAHGSPRRYWIEL